jgi:alkylation response protein AidB-like acyl-CoA dehydrogenase
LTPDLPLTPSAFLQQRLPALPIGGVLCEYDAWWAAGGVPISAAVDRQGTPWLRMFDAVGRRVDEVLFPAGYRDLLLRGYQAGVVWRAFDDALAPSASGLAAAYLLGYVTSFYDPGLYCPYTVSLSTAVPLAKYGAPAVRERFLPSLLRRDDHVWQGATWMTEAGGGSDLGAGVVTVAEPGGECWRLNGDKYFASNVGAELAVVAARPAGAPPGVRGLALFLVPRLRADGGLNYLVRRLKDKIGTRSVPTGEVELRGSEGYLLGEAAQGVYLILETLNLSRVANSLGSVALAQRALTAAWQFAQARVAFGRPIAEHPLLRRQFDDRCRALDAAWALAWESVVLLQGCWQDRPPYTERYHLFRLVAHLAKYWTAELAVQLSRWAIEVHGGLGILAENQVERLLREALILQIWEGTPHRQMLDGLEVMLRRGAHRLLFDYLAERGAPDASLEPLAAELQAWLALPAPDREAAADHAFPRLASGVANVLADLAPPVTV